MSGIRVLYILKQFPQMSETYVKTEIEAISQDCHVMVIGLAKADLPYVHHAPYKILQDWDEIDQEIRAFKPNVLHTHWLYNIWKIEHFARKHGTPYTVRAHSFDTLTDNEDHYPDAVSLINDDLCLGALIFPFARASLEKLGIRSDKLHDCFPVVHYKRFYDRSPNGDAIMNVGACIPKKKMEDFLELGRQLPHTEFNLYAMGYDTPKFIELNKKMGHPINIIPPLNPEDMPAEYKKHRWLVYTASRDIGTVGWPMAIAEAQASGVGVCMADIRPDLKEYVGEAGFVFDSVAGVKEIITKPFPEELRQLGFEQAKKSNVFEHKSILLDLWRRAPGAPQAGEKLAAV